MKILTSFALVLVATVAFAQTRINVTMEVDSVEREFIVALPSGAVPPNGYPVVFMLHGSSGDGEKFYNISGWKEKGEIEKILTVFPSSLSYCVTEDSVNPHMTTKWNNGDLQTVACPGQTFKDDVKFFRMMVDTIRKTLDVDASRIYVSGFSNGGVMAAKLAVEASDIFAAVAAAAGPLNQQDSGVAKRMIPTVFSVGTLDDRYYTAFGLPEIPFNDTALFLFRGPINRFLTVFGLNETYTKDSTANILRYRFNTLAVTAPWEFNFILFKDLAHEYPNGTNYPLSAPELLWTFFQQYSLPLDVKPHLKQPAQLALWPNPAHRHVTIQTQSATYFRLFSSLGEKVFESSAYPMQRIELPALPAGIYFAAIESTSGTRHTKLVIQ